LRHESKGTEQRPAEVVEVGVAVIRVLTGDYARVVDRALSVRQIRPRDTILQLKEYVNNKVN